MKSLTLVQLPIPQITAFAPTGNVPLAVASLAGALRKEAWTSNLLVKTLLPSLTDTAGDTQLVQEICASEPDYVGLSLYLWNTERSLYLAEQIKKNSPHTKIILGGPEVSADNPFVLQHPAFDIAVTGEAEQNFVTLLHRLIQGENVRTTPNVAVRTSLGITPFAPAQPIDFPLSRYPSPYLSGDLPVEPERSIYVETVRGCRSQCTFCFYPRSSNVLRALELSSVQKLLDELKNRGAKEVVFLDPTFNHRPDFDELLQILLQANSDRTLNFFAEVRAEGLTPRHAKLLARAGFSKLEIGLQSVDVRTLKTIARGGNPQKVAQVAKNLKDEGIVVLTDLIVGLPGDNEETVLRGVDFLLENDLSSDAQIFPLSVLPGTAMRQTARNDGLIYDERPPYRIQRTRELSEDALTQLFDTIEDLLDRPLDEHPRPKLFTDDAPGQRSLNLNVEQPTDADWQTLAQPAPQHVALFFTGADLFAYRDVIIKAVEKRIKIDPHGLMDIVLQPRCEFPMDLLGDIRNVLQEAPTSYAAQRHPNRFDSALRRLSVVFSADAEIDADYLDTLQDHVAVYQDQSVARYFGSPIEARDRRARPRITNTMISDNDWQNLVRRSSSDDIAFANKQFEQRWVHNVLNYCEIRPDAAVSS